MTRLAGSKITAVDYALPAVVTGFGNGTNAITATVFTVLPTNTCTAVITNPHPTASMICLVTFGAWMASNLAGNGVSCCPAVSGSVTYAAGTTGGGGPVDWGEIPYCVNTGLTSQHHAGSATYILPASATPATFSMQAMRDTTTGSTQVCNYPTIRIIPLYFAI